MDRISTHNLLGQLLQTERNYRTITVSQSGVGNQLTLCDRRIEVLERLIQRTKDLIFPENIEAEDKLTKSIEDIAAWSDQETRDALTSDLAGLLDKNGSTSPSSSSE